MVSYVTGYGNQQAWFPLLEILRRGRDIPDLEFPATSGQAARHGQLRPVRRKRHRFNPLRCTDEPRDQTTAIRVMQQHLVVAGDGQQASIRGTSQTSNHRRCRVRWGVINIVVALCALW